MSSRGGKGQRSISPSERPSADGPAIAATAISPIAFQLRETRERAAISRVSLKNAEYLRLLGGASRIRTDMYGPMYGPSPVRKVAALMADIRLRSCIRPLDGAPCCTPGHDGKSAHLPLIRRTGLAP